MLKHIIIVIFFFISYFNRPCDAKKGVVAVGVVLDLNSTMGSMVDLCMKMAVTDFYAANPNYTTRLKLHTKNAHSVLDANLAVLELLKQDEVSGVLGPYGSKEETFAAAIGETVHVPIISFTSRSSAPSYKENRYFVRTALDDTVQAHALAAVCQRYEWPEVVILYEDSEYGNNFLSHLNEAFHDVGIELAYRTPIPTSADDTHILKDLTNLNKKRMRVFLVHVGPALGSRLFDLASSAGMMRKGYAWVITDSLSIFLDSMDSDARDKMDGVLGVRPYLFASKKLKIFEKMWKRNMILNNTTSPIMELNIHGLWAYDAVTALAIAIENIRPLDSSLSGANTNKNKRDSTSFKISYLGPRLLSELSNTKFSGLAGDFELVDGKLKASSFEIFNVIGSGERKLGFWTQERGLIGELSAPTSSSSTKELKNVLWPGNSLVQPKGRAILETEVLRVGIPWKSGYKEFVDVKNITNPTGFCISIFLAAWKVLELPMNYTFVIYNDSLSSNWSYDSMLRKIPQEYDMVVADATIWAPRAEYVDFSLPYSESGVVLVVRNKKPFSMWTFVKPFALDLWLMIIAVCVFLVLCLYFTEHQKTDTGEEPANRPRGEPANRPRGEPANRPRGEPANRPRGRIHWYPIEFLVFPERDMVSTNYSVVILICWGFMAYILMQSYTANLSAILTVDQLEFDFSDDYYVGYHTGSFMKQFLIDRLHIRESRLRAYSSPQEFNDAMSKGSKNGGVDAIFDEIPYMKIFLNRYKPRYKIIGPTYRTGGMGFAFPIGSPLVSHFSKAILDVTQGPDMNSIELENFGPGYSSQDPLSSVISQGTSGLTLYEFGGLFIIIGPFVFISVICSIKAVRSKFGNMLDKIIGWWNTSNVRDNADNAGGAPREDADLRLIIEPVRHDHDVELRDLREIVIRGAYIYD